ncbi:splicing factor 3B subunit 2 [Encephalitozoon intestinalis ATCC 50506]|uniref:Splicing factor 3B subunit 2 n=1 Tax=Encephalitozoon intestinalis (strain ATCC 50506) TaxID=876142 RepID=E0SA15_ENCIT|nr:splicing factor 3B subunit 2 [Encephalitozoon intestinalis ATCC 50506]ADM12637.2 splicing factor 3B subunit 2 [Encephalitozoon intestinalis ATCC 50506]UTX46497.1 DUF382 domain-containing protein [Encephalitozoon intestinalis]
MRAEINDEYGFIHEIRPNRNPLNKRQRKKRALQHRYEDLKLVVPYPELFEFEDVTCPDPIAHNKMKGQSSVPVPSNWRSSSGRMFPHGYHKPGYQIPWNVMKTGIPELRRMMKEREAGMSLRERVREKLYPKLGKSLVDQRILYEAFSIEEKPHLSSYGEFFKPGTDYFIKKSSSGTMSVELMEALGIDNTTPPPWLFKMQKYGMPPSYPNARIPGLNAPIPEGCMYGYQPRGWGEPLVEAEAGIAENGILQESVEVIYNTENQYTKPVYIEELEERVTLESSRAEKDEAPEEKAVAKEEVEAKEKRRSRKEKLYKSIKF